MEEIREMAGNSNGGNEDGPPDGGQTDNNETVTAPDDGGTDNPLLEPDLSDEKGAGKEPGRKKKPENSDNNKEAAGSEAIKPKKDKPEIGNVYLWRKETKEQTKR